MAARGRRKRQQFSAGVRGRYGKSQGCNGSMSGSNQDFRRINFRRMELSTFIDVPSTHSIHGRRPGRQEGATAEKAVPSPVPFWIVLIVRHWACN
jgi:hypothetical protein